VELLNLLLRKSAQSADNILEITHMLDDPSAHIQVNRIIVFDAGDNGVKILREKSKIEDGKRILDDADAICLKECESNINRCIRQKAKIQKENKDEFDTLKNNLEEEKRIRGKDKVYRIDTELDQIMTCFTFKASGVFASLLP